MYLLKLFLSLYIYIYNMNCFPLKNNNKQLFTCYWGGYFDNDKQYPQTLDMVPNFIDIVILAFVGPIKNSKIETTFLCSNYSAETIKMWIKKVQQRGIKVYVSILDTPDTHWDSINLDIFSKSLKELIVDWNLDGVDIDAESGMNSENYVNTFINLINSVKTEICNLPLTYTCYMGTDGPDGDILRATKDKLEYIQLMAYFFDYNSMIMLYNDYKTIMDDNIIIGVKAGEPDMTDLNEVKKLCLWNTNKKGMMLWTFNRDTPQYTNQPLFSWLHIINNNLNLNKINYILEYLNITKTLFLKYF